MNPSRTLATFVLCLAFSALAGAQEITGTIRGVVTDTSGAVVGRAGITVTNTDTKTVVRRTTSGSTGQYSAPLLPVGHYTVAVEAPGFSTSTVSNIELNVNDRLTIDVEMKVGATTSDVNVEAAVLQVDTQSATPAGLISGTQIRELSINNRNYEQLVALQPGVSSGVSDQIYVGATNPSGLSNQVDFSINGNRPTQNNWTLDGADNVDRGANLTLLNYPSIDAIEEFKVLRGQYNPEFGRGSAGQINVITRSGTSQFHGGAYEFFRNDILNANNFFNNKNDISRPALRYHNFGWTLGGPLRIPRASKPGENKTFFFFSQEFRRVLTYTTFSSGEIPTAEERAGTFASPVCLSADCSVMGTQVTQINPVAQAYVNDIFSKLPLPGPDGTLTFVGRNRFNFRQETIKIDHTFSPKLALMGRFMNDSIPTEEPGGLFTASALPGVANTKTKSPGRNLVVRATMTFSPSLLNEAGYAYSYGAEVSDPVGLGSTRKSPNVRPALPFPSQVARVPSLTFFNGEGLSGFGPYHDDNRNHNWFDTLTKVLGTHAMKFGGSYHRYLKTENSGGASFNNGLYFFSDVDPNGNSTFQQEWASFLTGNVLLFAQSNIDPRAEIRQLHFETYAQDEWRIRPTLTLSYGVRYSLFSQPTDANGMLTSFDRSRFDPNAAPEISALNGDLAPGTDLPVLNGIIIARKNSPYGDRIARTARKNFAPRIGLAWDPIGDGRTSIRAGYGIFYEAPAVNIVEENIFNNPPFIKNVTISNTSLDNPGSVMQDVNLAPNALFATEPRWRQPYTQQWSLDLQREVMPNLLVDVGYYAAKGSHLVGLVDINEPLPGAYIAAGITGGGFITQATTPLLNQIRPYRGFDAINMFMPVFSSKYRSLQAQMQKRFAGNSLVVVNYTWSRAMTDAQNEFRTPQNTYDFHAEWGPAQFDRRHIVTANYVYELPWFRTRRGLLGHVLGGWEVSGITTYMSGLPLTVTGGRRVDPAGLGVLDPFSFAGPRPDQVSDPNQNAPHTIDEWFDKSAFADVPLGEYRPGNAHRGSIRGPGIHRWDASLFKNFRIRENLRAQFRGEAFNILNHTNFDLVRTNLQSKTFGSVRTSRDARVVQLGLKLNF